MASAASTRAASPAASSPADGGNGKRRRQYDRSREYAVTVLQRTLKANPNDKMNEIWNALKGKSPHMQRLQDDFLRDFREQGFSVAEASRWSRFVQTESFIQDGAYLTEEQILAEEKGSAANTKARIEWAKGEGEGTPEPGKGLGFYRDPMRGGALVFKYFFNVTHRHTYKSTKGRETTQHTGPLDPHTVMNAPPGQVTAKADPPLALADKTPPQPATALPGAADGNTVAEGASADSIKARTERLLLALTSQPLLLGFVAELEKMLEVVMKVKGVPRASYRCIKQLQQLVELTEKVLPLVEGTEP
jgi:hypothetical protein